MTAVESISRFVLRTGAPRLLPTREDDLVEDPAYSLPGSDQRIPEAIFDIVGFSAASE